MRIMTKEEKLNEKNNNEKFSIYQAKSILDPTQFHKAAPSDDAEGAGIQIGSRRNRAANPRESFVADSAIDVLVADLNSGM